MLDVITAVLDNNNFSLGDSRHVQTEGVAIVLVWTRALLAAKCENGTVFVFGSAALRSSSHLRCVLTLYILT